jgi:hypothetical protein
MRRQEIVNELSGSQNGEQENGCLLGHGAIYEKAVVFKTFLIVL